MRCFKSSFTELLGSAEDFLVDIPKLWEYVAQLVEPLFEEGVINLNFLGQLSAILKPKLVTNFVAAVLKELVNAQVRNCFTRTFGTLHFHL